MISRYLAPIFFSVLAALPTQAFAGSTECSGMLPSWSEVAGEGLSEVKYVSALTGRTEIIDVEKRIGFSSAKVYHDSSLKRVVKVYRGTSELPAKEILLTRFLREHGRLNVAEVLDYSPNAFARDGKPIVVIKEFIEGIPGRAVLELHSREFASAVMDLETVISDKYKAWLHAQPEFSEYYLESVYAVNGPSWDMKIENWFWSKGQWVLIDP